MNEKPKSIWRKNFTGRTAFVIWLAVVVFTVMLGSFMSALTVYSNSISETMMGVGIIAGGCLTACLILIYFVWPLLRWLFWTHWRRGLFALACFVTVIALIYAEEDWRGWHAWNQFKHEWEARGEHFDFASIIPPPVPDDQNFALTPVVASCYEYILDKNGRKLGKQNTNVVNRLAMDIYGNNRGWESWPTNGYWVKQTLTDLNAWQQFYRTLAAKTNEFEIPAQPQSPARDVLLALSKYDATVEDLRQASRLPYSRFPLNYDSDHPFNMLLPHLAAMKRCSQFLQLRAIAELQAGEPDQALADVKLSLRLVESIRTEPVLICELVRIALTEITLQPVYEGLADHRWSDSQLLALDAELARLDFLTDFQTAIRGERAGGIAAVDYYRRHRNYRELFGLVADSDDNRKLDPSEQVLISLWAAGFHLLPDGWFYQNELSIARMEQIGVVALVNPEKHLARPPSFDQMNKDVSNFEKQAIRPWNVMARMVVPALGASVKKSAREQISVDLARTAIALERCRLAHGEFPETLDALAPQFIAKVPHDVIGGGPLKYRRTHDGQFVLYSVGWNDKDDGGVVMITKGGSQPKFEEGDWVWRYPQK